MEKFLRILFIEDSEDDVFLITSHIQNSGYTVSSTRVDNDSDFVKALEQKDYWDVILSDYALPGFSGRKALDLFRQTGLKIPFILVSGALGEDIAVLMLKSGASDFVLKGNLRRLVPAIERGVEESKQRRERLTCEQTLSPTEGIVLRSPVVVYQGNLNLNEHPLFISDNFSLFGFSMSVFRKEQVPFCRFISPEDIDRVASEISNYNNLKVDSYILQYRIINPKQETFYVRDFSSVIRNERGEVSYREGAIVGIPKQSMTPEKQLENLEIYRSLFQDSIEMLLIIAPDTLSIIDANRAACIFYGYTQEQMLQKKLSDLSIKNVAEITNELSKAMVTNNYRAFDRHILQNGQIRTLEIHAGHVNLGGKAYIRTVLFDLTKTVIGEIKQDNVALYKDLLDTFPNSLMITDMSYNILYVNTECVKLFGYMTVLEMVNLPGLLLLTTEYAQEFTNQHVMETLFKNGQIQVGDVELVHKNGNVFVNSLDCRLIKDSDNDPVKILIVFSDTSKQNKARQDIERSEQRFRSNFENAPIGIAMVTMDNSFIQVNQAFIRMLKWENHDHSRTVMSDLFQADDVATYSSSMQQLLDTPKALVEWECGIVNTGKQTIQVRISANLISYDSIPQYFLIMMEDVTSEKQAVQEIIRAKQKAEISDRVKSAILSNMSHEFRTPLNGILGFSYVLHNLNVSVQINDIADMIEMSGRRLMQTLDALLTLSQLESLRDTIQTNMQYQSLSYEISKIAGVFIKSADIKGLSLKTDIAADLSAVFDSKLLTIMITNLLDNAIKFTDKGSIHISLRSGVVQSSRSIIITVKDEGIGMPEHYIKQMFDDFSQHSDGFSRSYEGSGIGLAITHRIVKLFKGDITVKSKLGTGTEITVIFPCLQPESVIPQSLADNAIASWKSPKELRFLIVEDNLVNSKLMVLFLRDYAKQIDCAITGEAGVRMARTNSYDIVFMDINLGAGIDGIEATQIIRIIDGYQTIPIIAVTGYTMMGEKERILDSGLSHYIGKPFGQKEINAVLKEIYPNP